MSTFVRCMVCFRRAVVFVPIPLCKMHENTPEIPAGIQDSDEEFVIDNPEDYNSCPYEDFPIPVYPI